jgi:DNA-binding NarL/FixJ family response regulator
MAKGVNDSIGFAEIHTQLRILNRLMAAQLKPLVGQQDLVRLLAGSGATNAEIADVLDTTPATVATTVQRLKRRTKSRAAAPRDDASDTSPNEHGGGSDA